MRQSMKPQTVTSTPTLRQRAEALRARVAEPAADPIHAALAESKILVSAVRRARRAPDFALGRSDEEEAANDAAWLHYHATLLRTPPTTAAGAVAFARHFLIFHRFQGRVLEENDLVRVLTIIAAAPVA